MINAINKYNAEYFDEAISLLLRDKRIKDLGRGKFGISLNEGLDKEPYFIKNPYGLKVRKSCQVVFSQKNTWTLSEEDMITPFDIYTQAICFGNTLLALNMLNNLLLKKKPNYVRVGTDYFKKVSMIDRDEVDRTDLCKWKKETMKDDYGLDFLNLVPKYDAFGIFPDNKNYQPTIRGRYNQYSPFSHLACTGEVVESDIPWSMNLIRHVWGEQWELGLIYMQLLYLYPKQILPILALVSAERETGKSTFGDWLNIIFGDNTCVITASNIASTFNSSYATKNIMLLEETKLEKSSDLEKIKAIATQKKITVNTKFMPEYSIPFYGKIVMFSNHEDKFVKIDEEENRYWVLKVPTLEGKANHGILKDLTNEVPKFLKFLEQLPVPDFTRSRMVFTQDEISTNILKQTKINSRTGAHKDIEIYLEKEMLDNTHKEFLYFRHEGLYAKYFRVGSNYSISYIKEVLRNEMHLKMDNRTTEALIDVDGQPSDNTQKRAYMVKNIHFDGVPAVEETMEEWLELDEKQN